MASKKTSLASQSMLNPNEVVYQAVVVVDSYNSRFYPLTKYSPRVLFPLVNVPVLQYTLASLHVAGIQTVYLFCTDHAEEIQKFVNNSKWGSPSSSMTVAVIVSRDCLSFGDALRELDKQGLIRSEFLLLTGDVVANVKWKKYIDDFRELYKRDKSTLMTMLCKKAAPRHQARTADEDSLVVIDDKTQRVLHTQKLDGVRKVRLPLSVFADNAEVRIRYDLLGCQACVCSQQVLPLFSDNFDFQTQDDFVKGILENEEILGNTIRLQVLEEEYVARMFNFHSYDVLSKDVIDRWAYPFVPDLNMFDLAKPYGYLRNNVYLQKDVSLPRKCDLKSGLVIGSGTSIGNNAKISRSVIGNGCRIGNNVTIANSYVWDDAVIDDDCTVEASLLASGVHLLKNVKVEAGTVLGPKVKVGPSVTLHEGTVWTADLLDDDDDFGDEKTVATVDKKLVGNQGKAYRYVGTGDDGEDLVRRMRNVAVCTDDENFSDSASSASDVMSDDDNLLMDESKQFFKEVLDSLLRAVEEKIPSENIVLEINSSKHAYNISVKEVNMFVTKAILGVPTHDGKQLAPKEYLQQLKPVITQFLPLLRNYIKSASSQDDCLRSMEEYALAHEEFAAVLVVVIRFLYEKEILMEEAILSWYDDEATEADDDDAGDHDRIRKLVCDFVRWLQEAEEESEDDESD